MRAPLSWMREFTPVEASTGEIVAALNQLGLEVEGVEDPGREIRGVRAARILSVIPHPNADRLQLADVDTGGGHTRVVCGAPNIKRGMVVPFAPAGAQIPGLTLEKRKIRGETSDGMLCSARELGVGDDYEGILALDPDTELGADVRDVFGLDDVIFDLAITPNRPDAMCIIGIARELAGHFGTHLHVPEPVAPIDPDVRSDISVVIEDSQRCPRYLGRVAEVQIGPSPSWLAQRLIKAGMRPISNVVDVTNYVLLERNQPLHAFDLATLAGSGIVVRTATPGERMTTLDGAEHELTEEDLLICDAHRRPQALAGIMGGAGSEISDTTTSILLESAYFQPMGIARSSKRLKLRSESSARFERGIDPDTVATNAERAMELLVEVAGARVAPDAIDEYPKPWQRPHITVRTERVNAVLGTKLSDVEVHNALGPLGIEVSADEQPMIAMAPSWRPDLTREIDLIEEVARRIGFDHMGRTLPDTGQVGALTPVQRDRRTVADALVGLGLSEAITLPLVAPDELGGHRDRMVLAANPLRAEESALRTSILPGLLRAAGFNAAHGLTDVALFELGHVFRTSDGLLPDEPDHLGIVFAGALRRRPLEADRSVDVYDAADAVRAIAAALDLADVQIVTGSVAGWRSVAVVRVDDNPVGVLGEVDTPRLDRVGLSPPVIAVEVALDDMLGGHRRDRRFRALSRYPASSIDLAFVLGDEVSAAAVTTALQNATDGLLEDVAVFDEYRDPALGTDGRSLAFALRFRAPDRTLTDDEIGALRVRAIAAVEGQFRGKLRG